MTAGERGTPGYALLECELAALDDEPAAEAAAADPAAADDPDAASEHPLAVTGPRDLAYSVRLIDAAVLAIDGAVELAEDELSLHDLLATRDLALSR